MEQTRQSSIEGISTAQLVVNRLYGQVIDIDHAVKPGNTTEVHALSKATSDVRSIPNEEVIAGIILGNRKQPLADLRFAVSNRLRKYFSKFPISTEQIDEAIDIVIRTEQSEATDEF